MPNDRFEHTIDVIQDLLVPETQHSATLALQIFRAALIGLPFALLAVLAAIKLDYLARLETKEVTDVGADQALPPEFCAVKLTIAQPLS
jgi:hypothetical protein